MFHTNIADFKENTFKILEQTKNEKPTQINSTIGNFVLINEEDYNDLIATLEINSNEYLRNKIIEGINTPIEDCIPADEVEW